MIFIKQNKMKKRIEKLYQKMKFIREWLGNYDIVTSHLEFLPLYEMRIDYMLHINTKYGERGIIVREDTSLRYCKYKYRTIPTELLIELGAKYFWDYDYSNIFEISFKDNEMELTPSPMLELSAEEIDLAILEFEIKIDKLYQEALENKNIHDNCIKILSK